MTRFLASFAADESGATIIEMGLAAPLLATMLVGMIDLSNAYSAKLRLEQAAQRTVEKVQAGTFSYSDLAGLQTEAQTAAGTGSAAATSAWLECNGVRQTSYDGSCADGETFARYVSISVTKPFMPVFPMKWATTNSNGSMTISGRAGIRVQ